MPRTGAAVSRALLIAVSRIDHDGRIAPLHCNSDLLRELVYPVATGQQTISRLQSSDELAQHCHCALVPAAERIENERRELHRVAGSDAVVLQRLPRAAVVSEPVCSMLRHRFPIRRRSGVSDGDVNEQRYLR
jgi:hypothetical protein